MRGCHVAHTTGVAVSRCCVAFDNPERRRYNGGMNNTIKTHCSECLREVDPWADTDEGYTYCCNNTTTDSPEPPA